MNAIRVAAIVSRPVRLISYAGHSWTMAELAAFADLDGLDADVLDKRLRRGWPIDRALAEPVTIYASEIDARSDAARAARLRWLEENPPRGWLAIDCDKRSGRFRLRRHGGWRTETLGWFATREEAEAAKREARAA